MAAFLRHALSKAGDFYEKQERKNSFLESVMNITFVKEEMYTIINALDFYSRIHIGQYDKILFDLRWYEKCSQLDDSNEDLVSLLSRIRDILLPEISGWGWNASYGIFNTDVDYKAGIAYDMQQMFRYKLAYFIHPTGGVTVDFSTPLHCDNDPYDFPEAICSENNGEILTEISINNEQLKIICDALNINSARYNCQIRELFSFYTNNDDVLAIADKVTKILNGIGDDKSIKYDNRDIKVFEKIDKIYSTKKQ